MSQVQAQMLDAGPQRRVHINLPHTFFLHHFCWTLLKDGMRLDDLWPPSASSMTISLPVSITLLLLFLDVNFLFWPKKKQTKQNHKKVKVACPCYVLQYIQKTPAISHQ